MKKTITVHYLTSVGCVIDCETLTSYPALKEWGITPQDGIDVSIVNLKVDDDDGVEFENVTDEWLEALSQHDLFKIIKLMRDSSTKYRVNL